MTFDLVVKSGTAGYFDYDGCDLLLKQDIKTNSLPRKGDVVSFVQNGIRRNFLVTEIKHFINDKNEIGRGSHSVYCIPCDGIAVTV